MTQEVKTDIVRRMMRLFEGYADAYGTYENEEFSERKGKLEIRGSAKTVRQRLTRELWELHIEGKKPLGVIPIRDNDTCLWGCIDVDKYGLDHAELVEKLEKKGIPLVVCRSKSGGAHLFVFMSEPVAASIVMRKLAEIAANLGLGGSEVFPKQSHMEIDRGDLGSWLNMPYFKGDESSRHSVKSNGMAMGMEEFVNYAEKRLVEPDFFEREFKTAAKDPDFGDGPPCMQHLAANGLPEGTRNQGLFAFGLFAKKKFGERFVSVLESWNQRIVTPPLPSSEVVDIIKRLEKKDYQYPCKQQPISSHCNSVLCRTRMFGVGGHDDYPVINGISVLETEPPLWFVDIEDQRLEVSTDELRNYGMFQKVCMERLLRVYRTMKNEQWLAIVAEHMNNLVRIEAPAELGTTGRFAELLEVFVMDKHRAEKPEEMFLGKPYHDEANGRHYFRLSDLEKFLESSGFKIFSRPQMTTRIKQLGGDTRFFNLKGKGLNTWWVPAEIFDTTPEVDLPPVERSPI